MRAASIARTFVWVVVVAGTAILAAPEQTTRAPGQMTEAHVWVQNKGRSEAVPVELREVNLDTPLKVQVINGDAGFRQVNPVQVTEIRKMWDYQTATLQPAEDMAARLSTLGTGGWETTGIWSVSTDGTTTVLLKRPR